MERHPGGIASKAFVEIEASAFAEGSDRSTGAGFDRIKKVTGRMENPTVIPVGPICHAAIAIGDELRLRSGIFSRGGIRLRIEPGNDPALFFRCYA